MSTDCLFCKMINGEIPIDKIFEDEDVLAFNDIDPKAPLHVLVIPKKHIANLNELSSDEDKVLGKLQRVAAKIAKENKYAESGFRTVINCNKAAGQTVFHIHLHLLGGRDMTWPPG